MQVDSQTVMLGIGAVIALVPLLVLIVTLMTLRKTQRVLTRLDESRQSLGQILDTAAITRAALARDEESTTGLRVTIERLEQNTERFLAAQRTALEQTMAKLGAAAGAMQRHEELAQQIQSAAQETIDRFEQSSGRFLTAQQAVFAVAHDQLEKTAELLATPANGAQGGRLSHAANRIGGILRGVLRPTPALQPPEPQARDAGVIETARIPDNPEPPRP